MKPVALPYIIFIILTSIIPLRSVLMGAIPFWYDPARDMLLAWDNLSKLTLIGPPGGIPGIFYGPYWIWLLSVPMIITHNPRLVTLFAIAIPYLIFFPLILWKMRSLLGTASVFILWALFISNFDSYITFPWSPYLAALVFLFLSYLVTRTKPHLFLIGIVSVLVQNFNFSFGITVLVGTTIYVFLLCLHSEKKIKSFLSFLAGVLLAYSPVIIFETRHGFMQAKAFLNAFISSAVYHRAVVGQIGIPKNELLSRLLTVPAAIFHLPLTIFLPIGLLVLILGIWKGALKNKLTIFLLCCLGSLLTIYLSTKNPIWPYHFIGVETIFLLLFGLIMSKSKIVTILAGLVSFWLLFNAFVAFVNPLFPNYLTIPSLASKEYITRFVLADADSRPYSVFVYSPAVYTYDYDYLFRWLGKGNNLAANNIYLIIPPTTTAIFEDFIHYKTPDESYRTVWQKNMGDGTVVIKRQKT